MVTVRDLNDRGITVADANAAEILINSVTAAVEEAAGTVFTSHTSTSDVVGGRDVFLDIPVTPVESIQQVMMNGVVVEDCQFFAGQLYRALGWKTTEFTVVKVQATFGYRQTPGAVVDLICSLVAGGLAAIEEGTFGTDARVRNERIDDYGVGFAVGADAVSSAVEISSRTRTWLRETYGKSVSVMETRS